MRPVATGIGRVPVHNMPDELSTKQPTSGAATVCVKVTNQRPALQPCLLTARSRRTFTPSAVDTSAAPGPGHVQRTRGGGGVPQQRREGEAFVVERRGVARATGAHPAVGDRQAAGLRHDAILGSGGGGEAGEERDAGETGRHGSVQGRLG